MIVECHSHIWEQYSQIGEQFLADARETSGNPQLQIGVDLDEHWRSMEPVDRAVVLGFRARHVGVLVPNEYVASYVKQHPEKLVGFCSVDPNDADAVEQLDHAIQNLGLRGLKLGPIYQNVHPYDARMRALLKRASQLDIPVLIHQGTTFCSNVSIEVANPLLLERYALEFPDLRMVLAHLGHPWIAETIVLIRKHRNLFADISALHYRPWQFYNALVLAHEYRTIHKLLFGSDYPFSTSTKSLDGLRSINRITEGTRLPTLPPDELEALIERDTFALLGVRS